jgi:hypothetical protein
MQELTKYNINIELITPPPDQINLVRANFPPKSTASDP